MSVPADRSDPRKLFEEALSVPCHFCFGADAHALDCGMYPIASAGLAALDREAVADDALQNLAADHYFARAEKAEARAEAAEKALERLGSMESFTVAMDLEHLHRNNPGAAGVIGELRARIDFARSALAAAAGSEEA